MGSLSSYEHQSDHFEFKHPALLSSKLNPLLSQNSIHQVGGQLWIWIQLQIHIWVALFDLNFHCIDIIITLCSFIPELWSNWSVPTAHYCLLNWMVCPITPLQVVRLKNSFTSRGSFFQIIILSTNSPMLSLKLNISSSARFRYKLNKLQLRA